MPEWGPEQEAWGQGRAYPKSYRELMAQPEADSWVSGLLVQGTDCHARVVFKWAHGTWSCFGLDTFFTANKVTPTSIPILSSSISKAHCLWRNLTPHPSQPTGSCSPSSLLGGLWTFLRPHSLRRSSWQAQLGVWGRMGPIWRGLGVSQRGQQGGRAPWEQSLHWENSLRRT